MPYLQDNLQSLQKNHLFPLGPDQACTVLSKSNLLYILEWRNLRAASPWACLAGRASPERNEQGQSVLSSWDQEDLPKEVSREKGEL